jgi:hypothetical protein
VLDDAEGKDHIRKRAALADLGFGRVIASRLFSSA